MRLHALKRVPRSLKHLSQLAASSSEVIHIGPRGGRYKVDSKGRKVYLKAG